MNVKLLRHYLNSLDFEKHLNQRLDRLQRAEANPVDRMNVFAECRDDVFAFIDMFGVCYEPRLQESPDLPLFLFPHQREIIYKLIDAEENTHDLLIEKTRDMMATWTVLYYMYWRWRFKDRWYGLIGSRKEAEVDNACYSDDTEVLTKEGWKYFRDVEIGRDGDLFATRKMGTKEFEWQRATAKTYKEYDGDFYHIKSRSLDLMVSPGHRVLYRNNPWGKSHGRWDSHEDIKTVDELFKRSKKSLKTIPATSVWKGTELAEFIFPVTGKRSIPITMDGDDFCAFMGMWLAEGYKVKDGFAVTQAKESKGYNAFKVLLIKIFGVEPCRTSSDDSWVKGSKPIFEYLQQFGHAEDKFIPDEIMNSTPRQLGIFLYYYMLGDGSWKTAQPSMSTVSKKMADQLQELIQKQGFSSSITTSTVKRDTCIRGRIIKKENCLPFYILRIRTSRHQTFDIEKTHYKGHLSCVTVPNTILYVRRNGKPAWCGNTPQALFGKLRYIHYAMPKWMTPQGFRKSEHDIHMKLINPDQQSFLIGESANPNFARGNRAAMIFFDEMFFWRFARESWRSASDSTPCRIAVSTPAPSSFARGLRESMEVNKTLLTLDWKQHPFKDEAWYKAEEARRAADPLAVEGELNISYQADPTGAYYPSVALCPVRDYDYNPDLPLYVGLDFGAGDHTALVYFQRDAKNFYILDCMEQAQRNVHWFLPFLRHGYTFKDQDTYEVKNKFMNDTYKLEKRLYSRPQYELIQRFNTWKLPVMYCGEIAHRNRSQTGNSQVPMSVFTMLSGFGIFLRINNMGNDYPVRRTAVIRMLATSVFSSKYGALDVYDALINSRFAQGRENSTSEEAKNKPVHDEFADIRAACENYAVNMALGSGGSGVKSAPYGHHAWQSR
jgi:hypothetical protein